MILAVVPLRLASTRIPQKVLADIHGRTLAARTVGRVREAFAADPAARVLAAVDDERTRASLLDADPDLHVTLTPPELPSGTDRVFHAVKELLAREPGLRSQIQAVINVQGDMPFVGLEGLRQIAAFLREAPADVAMATLSVEWPVDRPYADPSAVKVITRRNSEAIYFSRHPIPYSAQAAPFGEGAELEGRLHVGVYGYRLDALAKFCAHGPTPLETAESLEQLRALWLGLSIHVLEAEPAANESFRGIDTPEDLEWARRFAATPRTS